MGSTFSPSSLFLVFLSVSHFLICFLFLFFVECVCFCIGGGENNFAITELQPVVFMVWGQSVPTDGHKPCGSKRSQKET